MAFGVFDLMHVGHRHFLAEAKKLGDYLIVVVALDQSVACLKGITPDDPLQKRVANLKKSGIPDKVLVGDKKQNSWTCVSRYKPDIIALGYDQHQLKLTLLKFLMKNNFSIKCVSISPYETGATHSNVIRKNLKH